jgi:hypothetical protein
MCCIARPAVLAAFVLLTQGATPVGASTASLPYYHVVPCPVHAEADSVRVSWSITVAGPPDRQLRGTRTIRRVIEVRRLYRAVCGVGLVTYDHPFATACPAALSSSVYHLAFLHRRRLLLRITEQITGCTSFTVDGRPDPGFGTAWFLPTGIPQPPV